MSEHSLLTEATAADAIDDEVSQSVLAGVPSAAISRIPTSSLNNKSFSSSQDEEEALPAVQKAHEEDGQPSSSKDTHDRVQQQEVVQLPTEQ